MTAHKESSRPEGQNSWTSSKTSGKPLEAEPHVFEDDGELSPEEERRLAKEIGEIEKEGFLGVVESKKLLDRLGKR